MIAINKKTARAENELALFRFTSATLRPRPRATTATHTKRHYKIERSILSRLYLQLLIINSYCLVIFLARNSLSSQFETNRRLGSCSALGRTISLPVHYNVAQ